MRRMVRRQVPAQARYKAPGVIVVTVDSPDGSTSSETVAATSDMASCARKQAESLWGSTSLDVELRPTRPPWLAEGDLVRLSGSAVDPEDGNEPYGQIMGFMIVGGVLIVQAGAGAGIYAPEQLTVVRPEDMDPKTLVKIKERVGEPQLPDAR